MRIVTIGFAVIILVTGCAGQQLRDLQQQNELLTLENSDLAERLESATGESIRLSRSIGTTLQRSGGYGDLSELEREHLRLAEQNRELRELLEQTVIAAIEADQPLPDEVVETATELDLFRAQLQQQPLPRDTAGSFVGVDSVSTTPLAPPDRRSPLANSGIVMEEQQDGVRRYYDAVVNRTSARAMFLTIEIPRIGAPRLFLVINERYSRAEAPLAFRRVVVSAESGSVGLPISAGRATRTQDSEFRVENAVFPFSSAAEAAVRIAIESEYPVLELGGIGSVSQRPISDAERTALTNVLYAFNTLSASAPQPPTR